MCACVRACVRAFVRACARVYLYIYFNLIYQTYDIQTVKYYTLHFKNKSYSDNYNMALQR